MDESSDCDRLSSLFQMEVPRRRLNDEEVQLLVNGWRQYRREIRDPLFVWLGWTEEELSRWQVSGELPV